MELRKRLRAGATAALAVALVLGLLWWLGRGKGPTDEEALGPAKVSPTCAVSHPFRPNAVVITGVRTKVLALGRDHHHVPRTPPLTPRGKVEMAWDRTLLPGSAHGNVLLNAHTWPDGSALGNRLLHRLHKGDVFELAGPHGQHLCYRVTERIQVVAATGFARYYRDIGRPQAAIIVCSGKRYGPDNWSHRTIWFASPVSSPA